MSHDAVSDFLRREEVTSQGLWEVTRSRIADGPDTYLIIDDSVQDKRYSEKIDLVKLQYSGAAHGLVRGIGMVKFVLPSGQHLRIR